MPTCIKIYARIRGKGKERLSVVLARPSTSPDQVSLEVSGASAHGTHYLDVVTESLVTPYVAAPQTAGTPLSTPSATERGSHQYAWPLVFLSPPISKCLHRCTPPAQQPRHLRWHHHRSSIYTNTGAAYSRLTWRQILLPGTANWSDTAGEPTHIHTNSTAHSSNTPMTYTP